jgi:hypothetical protein
MLHPFADVAAEGRFCPLKTIIRIRRLKFNQLFFSNEYAILAHLFFTNYVCQGILVAVFDPFGDSFCLRLNDILEILPTVHLDVAKRAGD